MQLLGPLSRAALAIVVSVAVATPIVAATTRTGPPGTSSTPADHAPILPGSWSAPEAQPILDKTLTVRLAPSLSPLSPGELAAVSELLEAGRITQNLYEDMDHKDAARARRELAALARRSRGSEARSLVDLYRLFQGPIATTLENQRVPFLAVDSIAPGKSFYPWGATKQEIEAFLDVHPEERAAVLGLRTIVRRADAASIQRDLATLHRHPVLDALHPDLGDHLREISRRRLANAFYAVPYPVAYPDSFLAIYRHLNRAATLVEPGDAEFAGYLRARARDLLSNDYESGDAAWVTGRFAHLNAQIGSYETYDDELFGVKASHGLSLLLADSARTAKVREATRGLQDFENSLPTATHKRVREDIPVGVYDVIADFGQTRGGNTATILPNESLYARRYGRTILLRRNIMTDPSISARARGAWEAAVAPTHRGDYDPDGSFQRTLWHELGHYLGVDRDQRGRELDLALLELADTFEEMKADLVSLYVAPELRKRGYYDDLAVRHLYASGVLRMLQKNRPRPDQNYNVMELMQMNWFLERGALTFDSQGQLVIHWELYPAAAASLLKEVLAVQWNGDHEAAQKFIARWTTWDERHAKLAKAMKATETSRFTLIRFAALGE